MWSGQSHGAGAPSNMLGLWEWREKAALEAGTYWLVNNLFLLLFKPQAECHESGWFALSFVRTTLMLKVSVAHRNDTLSWELLRGAVFKGCLPLGGTQQILFCLLIWLFCDPCTIQCFSKIPSSWSHVTMLASQPSFKKEVSKENIANANALKSWRPINKSKICFKILKSVLMFGEAWLLAFEGW